MTLLAWLADHRLCRPGRSCKGRLWLHHPIRRVHARPAGSGQEKPGKVSPTLIAVAIPALRFRACPVLAVGLLLVIGRPEGGVGARCAKARITAQAGLASGYMPAHGLEQAPHQNLCGDRWP